MKVRIPIWPGIVAIVLSALSIWLRWNAHGFASNAYVRMMGTADALAIAAWLVWAGFFVRNWLQARRDALRDREQNSP